MQPILQTAHKQDIGSFPPSAILEKLTPILVSVHADIVRAVKEVARRNESLTAVETALTAEDRERLIPRERRWLKVITFNADELDGIEARLKAARSEAGDAVNLVKGCAPVDMECARVVWFETPEHGDAFDEMIAAVSRTFPDVDRAGVMARIAHAVIYLATAAKDEIQDDRHADFAAFTRALRIAVERSNGHQDILPLEAGSDADLDEEDPDPSRAA